MRILVTGAAGFIGRHIVAALGSAGHRVVCATRDVERTRRMFPGQESIACDFNRDVTTDAWLPRLVGIDAVVNCVGILQSRRGQSMAAIHSAAPKALFDACVRTGVRRVMQISALGVGPQVSTAYSQSKLDADRYLETLDLDWVVLRPSLAYTPAGSFGGTSLFRALAALPWIVPLVGNGRQLFQPIHMLANPLEEGDLGALDPAAYSAEWKWDGVRVQVIGSLLGERRLFSRAGDDIGASFPDVLATLTFDAVVDGELLVRRCEEVAPFNDLQQRLNRKSVSAKLMAQYPAFLRLYDILFENGEDLRSLPFAQRRARLEAWHAAVRPQGADLSPLVPFARWDELAALRDGARAAGIEGLMLKRKDSPYVAGRPKGPWFKWKRGALTADLVLMYAQRGHGKRSSFYSDYTFGAWRAGSDGGTELVPVGKAYFGFTDEELRQLDKWIRDNTVDSFGPVREVRPALVLEVAFDSIHRSNRHKSGLAMAG